MRSPPPLSPRNSFSTCITHPRLLRSHFSIQHFWPCCLVPKWRTIWLSSPNRAGLQHSQCIHQQVLAFCSLNSSQGPSFNGGCELKITRLVLLADSMHELAFELPPVLLLLWWPLYFQNLWNTLPCGLCLERHSDAKCPPLKVNSRTCLDFNNKALEMFFFLFSI